MIAVVKIAAVLLNSFLIILENFILNLKIVAG